MAPFVDNWPQWPVWGAESQNPPHSSLLSAFLNTTRDKAASLMRFLNSDPTTWYFDSDHEDGNNDDDDDDESLFQNAVNNVLQTAEVVLDDAVVAPVRPKRTRAKYQRKNQRDSLWWKDYLAPAPRAELAQHPHGRLAVLFRRDFHTPYALYRDLVDLCKDRWYQEWHEDKVCRAGKPVSNLELKVLGSLYFLANAATHFMVSRHTNISEEVHRLFLLEWTRHMTSLKDDYIYMPMDEATYSRVVGEYTSRGFPGCIGSVDCVHIGWDRCPTQYHNVYTGKEGYPSIAYEVICTSRKFIQSVTVGHPGTRNDKHIVRTDESVTNLLYGNGWLNSKLWQCVGPGGVTRTFRGNYLLCDGGYHRWPCLISPDKHDVPGSPVMLWTATLESVRKDIEGVFGILKSRFRFLKNFNNMSKQSSIDNAFVTCCILHNMMLETDGYLDDDLAPYPGGLEERLRKKYWNHTWNGVHGMWIRHDDDTPFEDGLAPDEDVTIPTFASPKFLEAKWHEVTNALIDHHHYSRIN